MKQEGTKREKIQKKIRRTGDKMRKPNIWSTGVQGGEMRGNKNRDSIWCYNDWELSKIDKEHQGIGREALGTLSRVNKNKCALWHRIV